MDSQLLVTVNLNDFEANDVAMLLVKGHITRKEFEDWRSQCKKEG